MFTLSPATPADLAPVTFMKRIIEAGETYTLPRDAADAEIKAYFFQPGARTFKAVLEGEIVGVYYLRANREGGGRHVANAGFMVSDEARGKGIARQMVRHALETAKQLGFEAMQFNFVVSTNVAAVSLWQDVGFEIIGTIPRGFDHPTLGKVDAYIMHRFL